jgi:hypothetical protein
MKYLIALLVLASMAIIGCSDKTSQEPVSALSNDTPLPLAKGARFKMTVIGTGAPAPSFVQCTDYPGTVALGGTGSGNSTQLGRFTIIQGHCFNFTTGESKNGIARMTAANGDVLIGGYETVTIRVEYPIAYFEGRTWFLPGGTGRFANATGDGTSSGSVNLVNGESYVEIEGRLFFR